MKYRCVWFDLGLTLVQRPVAASYRQVLAAFGAVKDQAQIERAFYLADKTFMREYPHVLGGDGAAYFAWYLGLVNYHLGLQLDLERCCTLFRTVRAQSDTPWQPIPGAKELLAALHAAGVGTGLVSNWDDSCRAVLQNTGLAGLLDTVTVSCEVGAEKPDAAIFDAALQQTGYDAGQVLFVGDNYYDDVVGAQKVGIDCLLLAPYGRLGMEEIHHPYTVPQLADIGGVLGLMGESTT
jgi:putative hydrolase of the HAD superfamily